MGILFAKGVDNLNILALTLVIVGALNWLLIGLFGFDLVAAIFGGQTALISRIVYALVGVAGLWCLTLFTKVSAHSEHEHH
ncbi:MAG: DUF378 domain-containing protein [Clostridiales bacterium]|nr:DUF378 domain-containing protein [Clostridiales bacterium]